MNTHLTARMKEIPYGTDGWLARRQQIVGSLLQPVFFSDAAIRPIKSATEMQPAKSLAPRDGQNGLQN